MLKQLRYARDIWCVGDTYICLDITVGAQSPSTNSREETGEFHSMGSGIYSSTGVVCLLSLPILFSIHLANASAFGPVLNQVALSRKSPYVETAHKVCCGVPSSCNLLINLRTLVMLSAVISCACHVYHCGGGARSCIFFNLLTSHVFQG